MQKKPAPYSLLGVILSGGAGRRMGGQDKGLVPLANQPLAAHALARLAPQVDDILFIANRNHVFYTSLGVAVTGDEHPGHEGPLAGMLAGLREAVRRGFSSALFVPVDAPRLPERLAERLAAAGPDVPAVAVAPSGMQPVCCLMHSRLLPALETAYAAGERSPSAWLRSQNAIHVNFPDDGLIWSLNTPEELAKAEQQLRAKNGMAA